MRLGYWLHSVALTAANECQLTLRLFMVYSAVLLSEAGERVKRLMFPRILDSLLSTGIPTGRSLLARAGWLLSLGLLLLALPTAHAAILFADDFNQGLPGWTAIKPRGVYWNGPLRWEYDLVYKAIVERSNIYTDYPLISPSAVAPMLINGAVAQVPFTYSARMTAGDHDAFGLVFGYQDETNFYRLYFSGFSRAGFPYRGCTVDRKTNGVWTTLTTPSTAFLYTTGRTFDVSFYVDASNQMSVQIVDDPLGAATPYRPIHNLRLPTSANGRVGVMTWGMGSFYPRGFRIQNLALSPNGLQGDLGGWSPWQPVIPARASGSTYIFSGLGEPAWFYSTSERGPGEVLIEDSASFAGNETNNLADYTGPTVVAGDPAWSNYVVAARIRPGGGYGGGAGLLFRYQNASNFCRIGLRTAHDYYLPGMPAGLSVQKSVNRVFTQIYRDDPVQYDPAPGVPYDLVAQVTDHTLNVLLVADPDRFPQIHVYGPFDIAGVDRGKIGLFSWWINSVEFDRVTVQNGAALYVSSPLGSPSPGRGLNDFAPGQTVEATAGSISNPPGVRRTATGWVGAGSVPTSGTGSNVTFTIDAFSRLHWLWSTEYRLSVASGPNGTVEIPPGEWWPAGTNLTLVAKPDRGFIFGGWEGDSQSMSPTLDLALDQPYDLVATFAPDSDDDGLDDDWERANWGDLSKGPLDDPDEDGKRDLEERDEGTDPKLADVLRIENVQATNDASLLTVWNNTGARFDVEGCPALTGAWSVVSTNLQADAVPVSPTAGVSFLRLAQRRKPAAVPPFKPGSWTLAILPDTQNYSRQYPDLFKDQTRWIAANKTRYNIQYVLHVGDLVDSDVSNQWDAANAALTLLDGVVPYALVPGNHDYGAVWPARTTLINAYFPPSRFLAWPTFGGVKDAGKIENSYHLFSAGGADWLLLALEWAPRNATVAWANLIADRYPERRIILLTHAYLYADSTRYDWAAKGTNQLNNPHAYAVEYDPDGANDGEELWQKLVKNHPNSTFVFNGHVVQGGTSRLASSNDAGHVVHQILANYQAEALGGGAMIRLLEFRPNGKKVQVKTYSPYSGTYKTDPQNQFTLTLDPPLADRR